MAKLPEMMTAILHGDGGGPEVLVPGTAPTPAPKPDEVLIRVQATGVNRPDVAQRKGEYPPPPGASPLIGLETAGEVVALDEESSDGEECDDDAEHASNDTKHDVSNPKTTVVSSFQNYAPMKPRGRACTVRCRGAVAPRSSSRTG